MTFLRLTTNYKIDRLVELFALERCGLPHHPAGITRECQRIIKSVSAGGGSKEFIAWLKANNYGYFETP
jgi:hypothetical protein